MLFSITELRVHRTLQKQETIEPTPLLGPPPELIAYTAPVSADVTVDLVGAEILVSGKVQTEFGCVCSRCLAEFRYPIKASFRQNVTATEEPVDVSPYIKESVLLDLPLKALCRESCRGLCPNCGVNRNETTCHCEAKKTNAQWDALKDFPLH
jgi:uncharacterized protein